MGLSTTSIQNLRVNMLWSVNGTAKCIPVILFLPVYFFLISSWLGQDFYIITRPKSYFPYLPYLPLWAYFPGWNIPANSTGKYRGWNLPLNLASDGFFCPHKTAMIDSYILMPGLCLILDNSWAPSSEFVSSSIPSWQILTAHAQPLRGVRDLAFCLKVPLDSLLVWASSEGSGETARMRMLASTFAARIGDKYQIRLSRPSWELQMMRIEIQLGQRMLSKNNCLMQSAGKVKLMSVQR